MTTSYDLLTRALAIAGAINIVIEVYGGKPRYACSIRRKGLDSWEVTYDADPMVALLKAVKRLEDKRDLI